LLVGDLVQAIRESVTDQPELLPPPDNGPTTTALQALVSVLGTGTFYASVTYTTPWGETLPCTEFTVTITGPNNTFQVGPLKLGGFQFSIPVITGVNVYVGTAAGNEVLQFRFPGSGPGSTVLLLSTTPTSYQSPPERNSAYLPDTDGDAVNAAMIFRVICDALKLASQVCGGLLDYSGISSVNGSPQYIVPGLWKKMASCWYDGYPLAMDDNGNYFRRNAITASVLSSVALSTFNNQSMIEVWPQPARTAASTTLASPLALTDTQAVLTSIGNFLLTNGFVKIGNEIMSYSGIVGNTLTNLQRALSGTVQASIAAGQPVNELNLFWSGWRMYAPVFAPGSSMTIVPVPVGWESILFEYGLGRVKLAEQNVADYSKLNDSFKKQLSDWERTNRTVVGPRQIGEQSNQLETIPNLAGGWIVPAIFIGIFSLTALQYAMRIFA
jgi:hypothetical protein